MRPAKLLMLLPAISCSWAIFTAPARTLAADTRSPVTIAHDLSLADIAKILNRRGKYFGDKIQQITLHSPEQMSVNVVSAYGKFTGGDERIALAFDRKSGWHITSSDYLNKLSDETITILATAHPEQSVKTSLNWSLSDFAKIVNRLIAEKKTRADAEDKLIEITLFSSSVVIISLNTHYDDGPRYLIQLEFGKESGWRFVVSRYGGF